jgi:hypothetical protein
MIFVVGTGGAEIVQLPHFARINLSKIAESCVASDDEKA